MLNRFLFLSSLLVCLTAKATYRCIDALTEETLGPAIISDMDFSFDTKIQKTFLLTKNDQAAAEDKTKQILSGMFATPPYPAFGSFSKSLLDFSGFHSEHADDTWNYKAGLVIENKNELNPRLRIENGFDVRSEVLTRIPISELPPDLAAKVRAEKALEDCPCFLVTRRYLYQASPRPTVLRTYGAVDVTTIEGKATQSSPKGNIQGGFMHVVGISTDAQASALGSRYSHTRLRNLPTNILRPLKSHVDIREAKDTYDPSRHWEQTAESVLDFVDDKKAEVEQSLSRSPSSDSDKKAIRERVLKETHSLLFTGSLRGSNESLEAFRKKAKIYNSISYELSTLEEVLSIGGTEKLSKIAQQKLGKEAASLGSVQQTNKVKVFGSNKDGHKVLLAELEYESEIGEYNVPTQNTAPRMVQSHELYDIIFR